MLKSPAQIARQVPQRNRYCRFFRQGMRADCSVRVSATREGRTRPLQSGFIVEDPFRTNGG